LRICTKHRLQLVAPAHAAITVLPRNPGQSGGGSSRASSNPPQRLPSRLRWRPKRRSKYTANDRRSLSSRMLGSKSDVGCGNFDAGDKRRHRWKLPGLASVTTSSVGSAYGASSTPQPPPRGFHCARRFHVLLGPSQVKSTPVLPLKCRHARQPAPSCCAQRDKSEPTEPWPTPSYIESFTGSRRDVTDTSSYPGQLICKQRYSLCCLIPLLIPPQPRGKTKR
jgi:hypothetical protein